jgi:RHS repeat-associated protein
MMFTGSRSPPKVSRPTPGGWNYQFQGMRHDASVPLFEDRQRDMHPGMAWWMDTEPLGYVDGLNVYTAPMDDPVNPVDPLGT